MKLPENKVELVKRGNKVVYDLGDKIVKVFNETKPLSDVFNEALNLKRSCLGTRLRLLDKAKTALPHSIGIPAKQIARKTGVENGI